MKKRITLNEAIKFHGHLGPYLILGILAGEAALKKLKCKKYFGLKVKVWGADKKPRSCFIDGLQLSTGATYGKGNISKMRSSKIRALFLNAGNNKKLTISFRDGIINRLDNLKGHRDSEVLARQLYKAGDSGVFDIKAD
jgi:formylmethanofuran dehydrogenase subunit E